MKLFPILMLVTNSQITIDHRWGRAFQWGIHIFWFFVKRKWVNAGGRAWLRRNEREKKIFCFLHVKEGTCCRPLVFSFFIGIYFRGVLTSVVEPILNYFLLNWPNDRDYSKLIRFLFFNAVWVSPHPPRYYAPAT